MMNKYISPFNWKDHPNLYIYRINEIKVLLNNSKSKQNKILKNINKLMKNVVNENFKFATESDPIWIACEKNKPNIILGICMITVMSPELHFKNELVSDIMIPYLYNMIINIYNPKSKIMNISVSLMSRVIKDLYDPYILKWLDIKKPKYLNLDVLNNNRHAYNFYIKNKFINIGTYISISNKKYKMLTLILS